MGELKTEVRDDLLRAFKERAFRMLGFKKGSVKEAVEIALKDFVERVDLAEAPKASISGLRGLLKDLNISSVELQHRALELWAGDVLNRRERVS